MNAFISLLLITWLCVFIIDLSGIIESIETLVRKIRGWQFFRVPKPFACSLCSSWWLGLIYLLASSQFTLGNIALCALCALLSGEIYGLVIGLKNVINRCIHKLY